MPDEVKRPSEVFLRLWRYHTVSCGDATPADFALCADAWMQIREMEAMATTPEFRIPGLLTTDLEAMDREVRRIAGLPERTPDDVGAHEEDPGDPPDAPRDDKEPEKPARDASAISRAGAATRKRKALEALDAARAAGLTIAQIAEAGSGLTVSDVMDVIDRKALPMTVYAKLEKALRAVGHPPGEGEA